MPQETKQFSTAAIMSLIHDLHFGSTDFLQLVTWLMDDKVREEYNDYHIKQTLQYRLRGMFPDLCLYDFSSNSSDAIKAFIEENREMLQIQRDVTKDIPD